MVEKKSVFVIALCLFATLAFLGFVVAANLEFSTPTTEYGSGSYIDTNSLTINLTVDDADFSNVTINLYNSTDLINQTNITSPAPFIVSFSDLADGIHFFNASAKNSTGWEIVTGTNNVTIDMTKPLIEFVSPSSSSGYQNSRDILINASASDVNLGIIVINISKTGWSNKTTSSLGDTSLYMNFSNLTDGAYSINVTVNDSAGNSNQSLRTITIDTIAPNITLISPAESGEWTSSNEITFSYNVTDAGGIANCSVYLDEVFEEDDTSVTVNTTQTIPSDALDNDYYNWFIRCYDNAGNYNDSEERTVELNYDDSSDDDSGGGGGGDDSPTTSFWTNTYAPDDSSFVMGYRKELAKGNRVKVQIANETHYVGVINVSSSQVTINISSTPQTAIMMVGETKKFEVDGDDYYDISVKLNAINGTKADLTITEIHEKIVASAVNQAETNATRNLQLENQTLGASSNLSASDAESKGSSKWIWIIWAFVVLAGAGAAYYFFIFRKDSSKRVKTN